MTISFSRLVGVGYSDQRVSDWGVREAGWPVCRHGAPVGAGRPYPGPPRTHRAAVLRRVGHQGSSSAGIRRTFPHDGRVVPGVLSWAEGRSRGTGHGDGAVLSRAWSERGRVAHRDRWRDGPDSPDVRGGHGRDRARRDSDSGDRAPGSCGAVRSRLPRACRAEKRLRHRRGQPAITIPDQELVHDLVAVVHTFSGRLSGLRRYDKTLKDELGDGAR